MTDYFALVGLPRRPGLDETVLQETYLRLAALWHPDAPSGDGDKFRELQEARKTLLDPAARLRHLLEREGFENPPGTKSQPPADLFLEVAGALEAAKKLTVRLQGARSAIARASLARERAVTERMVGEVLNALSARRSDSLERISEHDACWPGKNLPDLDRIRHELLYLTRWENELRERLFLLKNPPAP